MIANFLCLHRKKRPCADMKRYTMNIHALLTQKFMKFGGEMKSRRRRRDRTIMSCEHGLIIVDIVGIRRAL